VRRVDFEISRSVVQSDFYIQMISMILIIGVLTTLRERKKIKSELAVNVKVALIEIIEIILILKSTEPHGRRS
jgi:hypothetical protein